MGTEIISITFGACCQEADLANKSQWSEQARSALELLALVGPVICLMDCLVIPALLAVLPFIGLGHIYHGVFDQVLACVVVSICSPVIVLGFIKHRKKRAPAITMTSAWLPSRLPALSLIAAKRQAGCLRCYQVAVQIAVALAGMVQVPFDNVVDVVAVGNSLMPAIWSVHVGGFVAGVLGCASACVGSGFGKPVLIHVAVVHVVKVSFVQIVGMAFVLNGLVPASRSVRVLVPGMCRAAHLVLLVMNRIFFFLSDTNSRCKRQRKEN